MTSCLICHLYCRILYIYIVTDGIFFGQHCLIARLGVLRGELTLVRAEGMALLCKIEQVNRWQ